MGSRKPSTTRRLILKFHRSKTSGGMLKTAIFAKKRTCLIHSKLPSTREHLRSSKPAVYVGYKEDIVRHHVNKLKNLKAKGFNRIHIQLNRRVIPVCDPCHQNIHMRRYDGIALKELSRPDVA